MTVKKTGMKEKYDMIQVSAKHINGKIFFCQYLIWVSVVIIIIVISFHCCNWFYWWFKFRFPVKFLGHYWKIPEMFYCQYPFQ